MAAISTKNSRIYIFLELGVEKILPNAQNSIDFSVRIWYYFDKSNRKIRKMLVVLLKAYYFCEFHSRGFGVKATKRVLLHNFYFGFTVRP